jgi:poly(3-hydroxybutyrate) depolymerase
MSKSSRLFYSIALLFGSHLVGLASELESGSYTINQDWSQEQDYERSYFVHVPESVEPLPLFIFLHGNGGNAERSMQGFTRRYKDLCKRYNMVFAQGYLKSWNIVSNRSTGTRSRVYRGNRYGACEVFKCESQWCGIDG